MIKSRALWPAEYGAPAVRNHPMTSTERWTSSLRGEKCRVKPACTSENQGWVMLSGEKPGRIRRNEEKWGEMRRNTTLYNIIKQNTPTTDSWLHTVQSSSYASSKSTWQSQAKSCGWSSSTYHPLIISTSPDSAGPLRCCTSPVIRRESWVCLRVVSNLFRLHPSGPPNKKSLVFSFHTILLAHLVFVHHFWGLTRRKERRQQTNATEMQTCER